MPNFPESLLNKVRNAPVDPGCYLFKSEAGKIIYIGKAKHLRNRVKSYFGSDKSREPKTFSMLKHIQDVEFIVTHSEIEALILENTLIKEHKPRYNIFLRDDKTFPYVRITNEAFPRVFITRKKTDDGSKYFGPYTDTSAIREILRIIKKVFTVRTCNYKLDADTINAKKVTLCLQYHIHNCDGPCQQLISEADYHKMISNVEEFLYGHSGNVIRYIRQKMDQAAADLKFEIAARYRDNLKILTRYFHKQSVEFSDFKNRDFISMIIDEGIAAVVIIRVRQGKMLSKDTIFMERVVTSQADEAMGTFIQRYYEQSQLIPKEINVNVYPSDIDILQNWLSGTKGSAVNITRPARKEKLDLLRLAEKNATVQLREYIANKSKRADFTPKSLNQLQSALNLKVVPRRIEAFDISNLQGKYAVGSLITFLNASPLKSHYRRYRIKTVQGVNDFAMMAEIVQRRYTRQIEENKTLPDLIVIDGGKGQLHASKRVLDKIGIDNIPVIGLAKKLEEIFVPNQMEPIVLPRDSIALTLLQKIRDEAHRFAITYHRKLRGKEALSSELDQIPGLGPEKIKELWNRFETIKKIRSASLDELSRVPGIGPKLARTIWDYIHHAS